MRAIGSMSEGWSELSVYPISLNCLPYWFRIGNSVWQLMHCMSICRA